MTLPYTYEAATLCKKLEKSYERILISSSDECTNARMDESEFLGPISAKWGTKNSLENSLVGGFRGDRLGDGRGDLSGPDKDEIICIQKIKRNTNANHNNILHNATDIIRFL